jgi:hypothetical protein
MPKKEKPASPVSAGRRQTENLQAECSLLAPRKSTAAIIDDYIGAAVVVAAIKEQKRRVNLRKARRQHRDAVHHLDALTAEIATNRRNSR